MVDVIYVVAYESLGAQQRLKIETLTFHSETNCTSCISLLQWRKRREVFLLWSSTLSNSLAAQGPWAFCLPGKEGRIEANIKTGLEEGPGRADSGPCGKVHVNIQRPALFNTDLMLDTTFTDAALLLGLLPPTRPWLWPMARIAPLHQDPCLPGFWCNRDMQRTPPHAVRLPRNCRAGRCILINYEQMERLAGDAVWFASCSSSWRWWSGDIGCLPGACWRNGCGKSVLASQWFRRRVAR